MIDFGNLPNNTIVDSFFSGTSGSETFAWTKPYGCNFIYILAVGGGGGGAGARGDIAGTNRSGGGGGASGQQITFLAPAFLVPDTLFIRVGKGGNGGIGGATGNSGNAGSVGTSTIISAYRVATPGSNTQYIIQALGGNGASLAGTISSAGGSASTFSVANSPLITVGRYQSASVAGTNGSQGNGTSAGLGTNASIVTGGTSGGGVNSSNVSGFGGSFNSSFNNTGSVIMSSGGTAGNNGNNGFQFGQKRYWWIGGTGGGGNASGTGGNGGNGAAGCGGGGGGAGITGGNGGNGGDGFVIIVSY